MLEKLRKEVKQLETIIENIKIHIKAEHDKLIINMFIKLNSPLERIQLLEELDLQIMLINEGIGFRITENAIVYQIKDQNFIGIYPQVNALRVEYLIPEGWENCKITDISEIVDVVVLIEESCNLMLERKK